MDISVVTPSYNQLHYLKMCSASVVNQKNVFKEHIAVDGASTDGTVEWLQQNAQMRSISETDNGMYDAINKGLRLANGRILAYLNCDEQYLPGTLEWVKEFFHLHADVDVIFGDALLIRPDGSLIAYWKGYQPRRFYILSSYLYVLSCTMFFRRRIIENGNFMDPGFKFIGDTEFVVRLLHKGYNIRHIRKYLSAFTMTGKNLSKDALAGQEKKLLFELAPDFPYRMSKIINIIRLTEKFLSGAYFQRKPLKYSVYVGDNTNQRKKFCVHKASSKWRYE